MNTDTSIDVTIENAAQLYNAIFERRSIRRYNGQPANEQTLQQVHDFVQSAPRLYPEIAFDIDIVDPTQVGKLGVPKAPHYLLFYSDVTEDGSHLVNAGHFVQLLDLYLHTLGLGRCWLGLARPKQKELKGRPLIITLCFGYTDEQLSRDSAQFKRKPLDKISSGNDPRLEAARLAPSGVNSQNWFFAAREEDSTKKIDVFRGKVSPLKPKLYEAMSFIDAGIAVCHLHLASRQYQLPFNPQTLPANAAPNKEGYKYLITV